MSGSSISWAICKSAPRSRQITTPAPHHSVFYRPDAHPAAQPTASKHWRHTILQSYIDNLSTEFANYNKCRWLLENSSVHKCVLLEVWNTLACSILAVMQSLYQKPFWLSRVYMNATSPLYPGPLNLSLYIRNRDTDTLICTEGLT